MSRYPGWQDESAVQRLIGQQLAPKPPAKRRAPPVLGSQRPPFSRVEMTATGYRFTWVGWLPSISGHQLNRYARSRLTKMGRRVFGELPPGFETQRRARVEVIRVLGPCQKPMDDDSISLLTGGLRDALTPSYIRDDSERWAKFIYRNDSGRRAEGPMIEIKITYQERRP